ncbi:hypothetical protein [Burkholderia territorii]|uniref:hypothetical protein n=1 Tax=Burkholderia territorii TaxID=1503055 RepID=UPI000AB3F9EE|nr:hypothetical protein [Burkholderia territorii]
MASTELNQGKKPVARRSAPLETQIRRVLHAPGSTICGAAARGAARRAPEFTQPPCGNRPARLARERQHRRVFIVVSFPQQKLSEWRAAPA